MNQSIIDWFGLTHVLMFGASGKITQTKWATFFYIYPKILPQILHCYICHICDICQLIYNCICAQSARGTECNAASRGDISDCSVTQGSEKVQRAKKEVHLKM